jgi:hypothetical protein
MGHKLTVRLDASVLEMVMLGSSVSLAGSLRIGNGEVCWIWQVIVWVCFARFIAPFCGGTAECGVWSERSLKNLFSLLG